MTKKRFIYNEIKEEYIDENHTDKPLRNDEICQLLNELYEEKEDWKNNCLKSVIENSFLWNEISIMQEQGAEPSDAFKNYLNGLKNKNKKWIGDD